MIYHRNSRSSHYSYTELFLHVSEVKKIFPTATGGIKHGQATLTLFLRPTKDSIEYTVKLYAKQGSKSVKVFVVNPEIKYIENRKKVIYIAMVLYAYIILTIMSGHSEILGWKL